MRITRLDHETVNCLISSEDLSEQGIELQDFFDHKESAMEFLKNVMQQAAEEVNYHPTGAYMPMQMTILPDKSLSLTLSENSDEAFTGLLRMLTQQLGMTFSKQFLEELGEADENERIQRVGEYLKGLKAFTSSIKDLVEQVREVTQKALGDSEAGAQEGESVPAFELPDEERLRFSSYVFAFDDMRSVIDCCSQIPASLLLGSSLYRDEDRGGYYLIVTRQEVEPKTFAAVFTILYEYGTFVTTEENAISSLRERMSPMLPEGAIERLRSL